MTPCRGPDSHAVGEWGGGGQLLTVGEHKDKGMIGRAGYGSPPGYRDPPPETHVLQLGSTAHGVY